MLSIAELLQKYKRSLEIQRDIIKVVRKYLSENLDSEVINSMASEILAITDTEE